MRRILALMCLTMACGGSDVLSLNSVMASYRIHMEDVARALDRQNLPVVVRRTRSFRDFMGSPGHTNWLNLMEIDARTRYLRIAKRLQVLEEDAAKGALAPAVEAFGKLRTECLDCHYINMKGTRHEAIEAGIPSLR